MMTCPAYGKLCRESKRYALGEAVYKISAALIVTMDEVTSEPNAPASEGLQMASPLPILCGCLLPHPLGDLCARP